MLCIQQSLLKILSVKNTSIAKLMAAWFWDDGCLALQMKALINSIVLFLTSSSTYKWYFQDKSMLLKDWWILSFSQRQGNKALITNPHLFPTFLFQFRTSWADCIQDSDMGLTEKIRRCSVWIKDFSNFSFFWLIWLGLLYFTINSLSFNFHVALTSVYHLVSSNKVLRLILC